MSHARKIPDSPVKKNRHFSASMEEGFASLRLEGIYLDEQSLDDLLEYDQGKITKQEAIDRALSRVKSRVQ